MAKLYFKYGVMGSSKSAQLLITRFNYETSGNKTLLLKPSIDTREGSDVVKSRIGLNAPCLMVDRDTDIIKLLSDYLITTDDISVILCDESQFLTEQQVEQLKDIACHVNIPVFCYGLLTDFQTKLFPGSKRLIELADSLQEIKFVCDCGNRASVNARLVDGKIACQGDQVFIGGNESYKAMCYNCYKEAIKELKRD